MFVCFYCRRRDALLVAAIHVFPLDPTQDYPWTNTDLTTYVWRTIHEGNMDNLKKIIRLQPDAVHVRSEDGRGGT